MKVKIRVQHLECTLPWSLLLRFFKTTEINHLQSLLRKLGVYWKRSMEQVIIALNILQSWKEMKITIRIKSIFNFQETQAANNIERVVFQASGCLERTWTFQLRDKLSLIRKNLNYLTVLGVNWVILVRLMHLVENHPCVVTVEKIVYWIKVDRRITSCRDYWEEMLLRKNIKEQQFQQLIVGFLQGVAKNQVFLDKELRESSSKKEAPCHKFLCLF